MRVLVIENQQKISRLLKEGLVQHGFTVDVCNDYDSGLASALYTTYDIIILDRRLDNGHDGIGICKSIRQHKMTTPILMLTAKDQLSEKTEGLYAGADDYLTKPFAFEELVARCHALIRRGSAQTDDTLRAGDLEMDVEARTVCRAGVELVLSSKEYAILEYLLRNKGRVCSKRQIIDNIWEQDSDVMASTVEVFIVYLRRKIDKPFRSPLIKTVHGFGYKIEAS